MNESDGIGGLILSFKERFQGKKYPVCKPYPHEPDIKIGYQERAGAYRLFCKNCGKRAQNAVSHDTLSPDERENAEALEAIKK